MGVVRRCYAGGALAGRGVLLGRGAHSLQKLSHLPTARSKNTQNISPLQNSSFHMVRPVLHFYFLLFRRRSPIRVTGPLLPLRRQARPCCIRLARKFSPQPRTNPDSS